MLPSMLRYLLLGVGNFGPQKGNMLRNGVANRWTQLARRRPIAFHCAHLDERGEPPYEPLERLDLRRRGRPCGWLLRQIEAHNQASSIRSGVLRVS